MVRVKTKTVQLHAFSIPGFTLPTMQKARLRIVRNRWRVIAKYIIFQSICIDTTHLPPWDWVYVNNWLKIK